MALVRFGGGVSEMRGSVAGTVYSRTKAGAIARNRTKPTSQPTLRQNEVRNQFQNVVIHNKSLTFAQVDGWNSFAQSLTRLNALGESYTPQGSQIAMECNMNLATIGQVLLTEAPISKPTPPTLGDYTLTAVIDISSNPNILDSFAAEVTTVTEDGYFVVEATLPHSAQRKNNEKYFRQIEIVEVPEPASEISLLAAYKNTFFGGGGASASAGQVISVRIREIALANGFSTPWVYADVTVTTQA